jgi:NAD(P)-dependent dehydrogenase (short-subunit alcohol dehydrogenase family)
MDRVKDKIAVVTGGAAGIGRADCIVLAREGATVVVVDIDDDGGKELVEEIKKNGGKADYRHMDVTKEEEIKKVFAEIGDKYGKIDILVNNAGIPGYPKPTHEVTREEWEKIINVDLRGVFLCTKYAYQYIKKAGGGSIINMSSMLGIIGGGDPTYHAAKGGVRTLTKSDATVYAADNIRVNSVHPGYILTPGFKDMIARRNPDLADKIVQNFGSQVPLGRMGTPEDVANGILFLASDESSYITGLELVIDGGYIIQ